MTDYTPKGIFIVLLMILIITYYIKKYLLINYWKLKMIPCESPYPVLGNIPSLLTSSVRGYLDVLYKKHEADPCFGVYVLETPYLILRCPELIKTVLVKQFPKFPDRGFTIDEEADPLASRSIFGIKNPEWKELRGLLSPSFASGKLKLMFPLINKSGEDMVKYIERYEGKTLNVKEMLMKFTCDATCSCTFGLETNCFVNEKSDFLVYAKKLLTTSFLRKLGIIAYFVAPRFVKMFKYSFFDWKITVCLHNLFLDVVGNREKSKTKRYDFIDTLIELKNQQNTGLRFCDQTFSAQALTFFIAGSEIVSTTIALVLYEIAMEAKVQEKLRKEICDVVGIHDDVTYEALNDMQYLHSVILESLRMYTHGIFLVRECVEECHLEPYNIKMEPGMRVLVPSATIHKDPKYHKNPYKFYPERFSTEHKNDLVPYTFLGFGTGPRGCIGERFAMLQCKVGIVHIIKNYELLKSAITPRKLYINQSSVLVDVPGGIPLKLKKIK